MACGTPVVATGTGGSGEILVEGRNCLLFQPEDAAAAAQAVKALAADSELRQTLVRGGYATADDLDVDRLVDELEAWIVGAADGFPAGRPPPRRLGVAVR
jgi:glycosyltransferase involved in cell wall biosynthesis